MAARSALEFNEIARGAIRAASSLGKLPLYVLKLVKILNNVQVHCYGRGIRVADHRNQDTGDYWSVYRAIERALWALGPALILFLVLSYPSLQAVRQEAATQMDMAIAVESAVYCTKWGMPAESPQHLGCLQDILAIRARSEQRIHDEIASDF